MANVNYIKLLIIEGLIRQVQASENRCNLTLKMKAELSFLRSQVDMINDYFEAGDPLESIGGIQDPENECEEENMANLILTELEKITWPT